jgi:hypothetical protein
MPKLPYKLNTEPDDQWEPLREGWYNAKVLSSKFKETKHQSGQYLQINFKALDGDHEGRVFYDRLNIINRNPSVEFFATETLKKIGAAVGIEELDDTDVLNGKSLRVYLTIQKSGDFQNNHICDCMPIDGQEGEKNV